jgi:hypothetical protein
MTHFGLAMAEQYIQWEYSCGLALDRGEVHEDQVMENSLITLTKV